ncbi:MarR family winged helix-turn-helix transcriptional regulator [Streptomyces daliensis]|uniref:Winged helix-turn-helix transcriptional regulator n=1 Tax=Streptomyces daliensis TaxID=299421 RepID=A0A8T4IU81_9ACTN|nr:winged helix-turn-helix transcriptional regulator [Streptomyces daliensis]
MAEETEIRSAADAAAHAGIQAFGVLLDTAALMERLFGSRLQEECGITHSMFEVLLHLADSPEGARMSRLSQDLILTSGGATRLVDRMVGAALVRRTRSADDGRVQTVVMTEEGERVLIRAARLHAQQLDEHFYGPLSGSQAAVMTAALDRLGQHARTVLPTLR